MIRYVSRKVLQFIATESAGGIALFAATLAALSWVNSPYGASYHGLWSMPLTLGLPPFAVTETLHHWINDGLMVLFFFTVGLEIKRETLTGEFQSLGKMLLPVSAALGGMIFPALLYMAFNPPGSPTHAGWGIPIATDIAFSLGLLVLLGKRVPSSLKLFLLALAIVDDIGAILVIALFYAGAPAGLNLLVAGMFTVGLILLNRMGPRPLWHFLLTGVGLWLALLHSGLHPTMAGIILAMAIPVYSDADRQAQTTATQPTRMDRLISGLHPWVTYGVLPVFALANAGVTIEAVDLGGFQQDTLLLGIVAGLCLGKPLGITLLPWLICRLSPCSLPGGVGWRHIAGVGCLGGIGFTISLFIANLFFDIPTVLARAKLAVLLASLTSGVLGWLWLNATLPANAGETTESD